MNWEGIQKMDEFKPGVFPEDEELDREIIEALMNENGATREEAEEHLRSVREGETWVNSKYQVCVDRDPWVAEGWPKMIHLSIKRRDKVHIHDWRDLQEIKNRLVGPNHEAVELYPAEGRLVDGANQYHLWVLAQEGLTFPFGFMERHVVDHPVIPGAKQRARDM